MGYRVSGILKLPDGSPASNAEIEFISRKNFSPLVKELKSNILCGPTGAYDVTLELGEYAVIVYPGGTYPAALGTIILSADTVAGQDLPTLLQQACWQPATPEYIQQIAQWLAEAETFASQATASAASAANSASTAGAAVSSHANATGLHLPAIGATSDGKVLKAGATAGSAAWGTLSAGDVSGVVGPVSSGAIIERGSNANGEYTKFADGTMICTHRLYPHGAVVTTWTFPASFANGTAPYLTYSIGSYGGIYPPASYFYPSFSSPHIEVQLYFGSAPPDAISISLAEVGRWK